MADDPRADLAGLAASLKAYVEWHRDTGTTGFPRRPAAPKPASAPPPLATPSASAPALPSSAPAAPPPPPIAAAAAPPVPPASAPAPSPSPVSAEAPKPAAAGAPHEDRHARLPQIAKEVAACQKCALAATRTQTVFSRGNPDAQVCFVGEAPGADEDAQGLPFVGRAGQLLDRMIAAMGLSPENDVYVCNIIKCRPPGNRRPEPEEIAACIPYLHEQLALIRPRVIVAMGNTSVAALLDTKLGITKIRGQWRLYRAQTLVMPTYHPSYLLRPGPQQAEAKRQAWDDLQLVMKELGISKTT